MNNNEVYYGVDLFAGGGGGLLASNWLGNRQTVCYCENNKEAVATIAARIRDGLLPPAPLWDDVGTFSIHDAECGEFVSGLAGYGDSLIVTAGFPCQPFSVAGRRAGAEDGRNGWPDTIRIIRELRPRQAFLENVSGLAPKARDWRSGGTSPEKIKQRIDKRRASGLSIDLTEVVCHSEITAVKKWPSPRASEYKGAGPIGSKSQEHMADRGYLCAVAQENEGISGKLNPFWGEWLMGWPIGWTSLEPLPHDTFVDWLQKTSDGTWWDIDPADVGEMERLETGIDRHKARWMQIGNGQVSLTAAVAEELLNE